MSLEISWNLVLIHFSQASESTNFFSTPFELKYALGGINKFQWVSKHKMSSSKI